MNAFKSQQKEYAPYYTFVMGNDDKQMHRQMLGFGNNNYLDLDKLMEMPTWHHQSFIGNNM